MGALSFGVGLGKRGELLGVLGVEGVLGVMEGRVGKSECKDGTAMSRSDGGVKEKLKGGGVFEEPKVMFFVCEGDLLDLAVFE